MQGNNVTPSNRDAAIKELTSILALYKDIDEEIKNFTVCQRRLMTARICKEKMATSYEINKLAMGGKSQLSTMQADLDKSKKAIQWLIEHKPELIDKESHFPAECRHSFAIYCMLSAIQNDIVQNITAAKKMYIDRISKNTSVEISEAVNASIKEAEQRNSVLEQLNVYKSNLENEKI